MSVEDNRQLCSQQQTELRRIMMGFDQHEQAIELFLRQHSMLHSAGVAQSGAWSYADEIFQGLSAEEVRRIPPKFDHSIAWIIWHIARCEDITMNLLVAGRPQILLQDNRLAQIGITVRDSGNAMDQEAVAALSQVVDIAALRSYRLAVGRRTREIVQELQPADLRRKVAPARVQRVMDEGAVVEAAREIADYWGRRTVAGLLLMPATRHCLIHLNEARQIKDNKA
jgi:hypothetical protein